jgi:hypothetical protein
MTIMWQQRNEQFRDSNNELGQCNAIYCILNAF